MLPGAGFCMSTTEQSTETCWFKLAGTRETTRAWKLKEGHLTSKYSASREHSSETKPAASQHTQHPMEWTDGLNLWEGTRAGELGAMGRVQAEAVTKGQTLGSSKVSLELNIDNSLHVTTSVLCIILPYYRG